MLIPNISCCGLCKNDNQVVVVSPRNLYLNGACDKLFQCVIKRKRCVKCFLRGELFLPPQQVPVSYRAGPLFLRTPRQEFSLLFIRVKTHLHFITGGNSLPNSHPLPMLLPAKSLSTSLTFRIYLFTLERPPPQPPHPLPHPNLATHPTPRTSAAALNAAGAAQRPPLPGPSPHLSIPPSVF